MGGTEDAGRMSVLWWLVTLLKVGVIFGAVLGIVAYMTLAERKVSGRIQLRFGPNRVGPFGLLQPVADGLKLMFKEDVIPDHVDKVIYVLAPAISTIAAFASYAVIPIGPPTDFFGLLPEPVPLQIADVNIGILYIFALSSMGVYGIVLAGWSSNNKYSLLGGLRSAAQMISYELSLGMSIVGVLMMSHSLSLTRVVEDQSNLWYVFLQPLGFVIFLIAAFAETNRLPFDLPEAEPELVAGYHTEYSSMKFSLFFMSEYAAMFTISAMAVTLYFGGWQGLPGLGSLGIPPVLWFVGKVVFFLFFFLWVRWTLPRFRYDQLMNLGWKVFLPLSLLNILLTGLGLVLLE